MDLVIRAERAVIDGQIRAAAVAVADGTIRALGPLDADFATGEQIRLPLSTVLLPGFVDTHVHINEPGTDWEGFVTATAAAAAGGITTLVDMPLDSDPVTTTVAALQLKREAAVGNCEVDVGFWAGVVPDNIDDLHALAAAGVLGFKCFLTDSGDPNDAGVLIASDRPRNMGDGWETRRRRDIGPDTHDAVMISFAVPAKLQRLEIDTSRFVFNATPEVSVLGSRRRPDGEHGWALVPFDVTVLPRTRIAADARQVFVVDAEDITALRVQAYPDGGIARVRAFGRPTGEGLARLRAVWEASA